MGLNCRPGQRAWVRVPRTLKTELLGMTALHGMVVQTVELHAASPANEPAWVVVPRQSTRTTRDMHTQYGFTPKGTVLSVDAIPDAYLRPFDDFPPEELEERQEELTS